jgi:hypothetical protein
MFFDFPDCLLLKRKKHESAKKPKRWKKQHPLGWGVKNIEEMRKQIETRHATSLHLILRLTLSYAGKALPTSGY